MIDYKILYKSNPFDNFNADIYPLDLQGWNGEHDIFKRIIEKILPKTILEIGSYKGQSTANMGTIIKNLQIDTKIVCVDTWLGSEDFIGIKDVDENRKLYFQFGYPQLYYRFLANMKKLNLDNIVIPFPQISSTACKWLRKQNIFFDIIYCDGDNSYDSQKSDIEHGWEILNNGGIIFGDDYTNRNWPGIAKAVNEFVVQNNLSYFFGLYEHFWLIKKSNTE